MVDDKELKNLKEYYDQTFNKLVEKPNLEGVKRELRKVNAQIFSLIEAKVKEGVVGVEEVKNSSKYLFEIQRKNLCRQIKKQEIKSK